MAIRSDLELDISAALDEVARLGQSLNDAFQTAGDALATSVTDALSQLSDAQSTVTLTLDADQFQTDLAALVESAQTIPVAVTVDTDALVAGVPDAIAAASDAIAAADLTVTVSVDAGAAEDAIATIAAQIGEIPALLTFAADTTAAADQIEALAAAVGDIPASLSLQVETTGVQADLEAFATQVSSTTADVKVDADLADADAAVQALVDRLSAIATTIGIDADPSAAEDALAQLTLDIDRTGTTITIDADATQAGDVADAVRERIGAEPATIEVTADTTDVEREVSDARDRAETETITIPVDADTDQVATTVAESRAQIESETVTVPVDADTSPALAEIDRLGQAVTDAFLNAGDALSASVTVAVEQLSAAGAAEGVFTLRVDITAAQEALDAFVQNVAQLDVTLPIKADTSEFDDALATVRTEAEQLDITLPIGVDTSDADRDLGNFVTQVETTDDVTLQVTTDTQQAEADIQDLTDKVSAIPTVLPIDADVSDATNTIDAFVQSTSDQIATIGVDADTDGASSAVDDLVGSIESEDVALPVDADTAAAESAIADLAATIESEQLVLPLGVDATQLDAEVQTAVDAVDVNPIDVPVSTDTGESDQALQELNDSLDLTAANASRAVSPVAALEGAAQGLGAAVQLAKGESQGAASAFGAIAPEAAGAAAAVLAGAAAFKEFFQEGLSTVAATERLNLIFGEFADKADRIDVGGLTGSLQELGNQVGVTGADMEQAVAKIGQLGEASGRSQSEVADISSKIAALGLRATALNPQLGSAADATNRLGILLGTGGRRLAQYSLDLNSAAIRAEALSIAHAHGREQASQFDRVEAGLNLAIKQVGSSLGSDFAKGAEQAQNKMKALGATIKEAIGTAGAPLVTPIIDLLQSLVPVATDVATALGALFEDVLPVIVPVIEAVGAAFDTVFKSVGDVLKDLKDPFTDLGKSIGDILKELNPLVGAFATGLAGALRIVLPIVTLVADAVDGFAQLLHELSSPVVSVVVGLGIFVLAFDSLALAAFNAAGAVDAFTASLAANPVTFAIVAAVTALSLAMHFFHDDAVSTAEVSKDLGQVLFGQVSSVESLSAAVGSLDENFKKFATSTDGLKKDAPALFETLKNAGLSAEDLGKAIEGSHDDLVAFGDAIKNSDSDVARLAKRFGNLSQIQQGQLALQGKITVDQQKQLNAFNATTAELDKLQDAYHDTVNGQLAYLQVSGGISKADLAAIEAKHHLADGTLDYKATLEEATAAAVAHEAAQSKSAVTDTKNADALAKLREQLIAGKISSEDAKAALVSLGITVADDQKQVLQYAAVWDDVEKAQTAATDAALLLTPAAKKITDELARGTITAQQAEVRFARLGISFGGLQTKVQSTTAAVSDSIKEVVQSITELATNAASSLPTFADAATKWAQDVSSATSAVASAAQKGGKEARAALKELADSKDPHRFVQNLLDEASQIAGLQTNLSRLIQGGFGDIASRLVADIGKIGVEGVSALAEGLANAPDQAKAARNAVKWLDQADLNAINFFRSHASTFFALGKQVADSLSTGAAENVETFGLVGQKLADSLNTRFGTGLSAEEANLFLAWQAKVNGDPVPAKTMGDAAQRAKRAFDEKLDLKPSAQKTFDEAVKTLSDKERFARAAGETAAAANFAYQRRLLIANATDEELGKVPAAVNKKKKAVSDAAAQLAESTNAAFGGKLTPDQKVDPAFQAAAKVIDAEQTVKTASGVLGFRSGVAFVIGLSTSIEIGAQEGGGLETAGAHAAEAILRGANTVFRPGSPSKAGIEMGRNFVEGIAVGISDTSGLETVSAGLATRVISSAAAGAAAAATTATAASEAAARAVASVIAATAAAEQADAVFQAVSSFAQTAVGALHDVGSNIGDFQQRLAAARTAEREASAAAAKARREEAAALVEFHRAQARLDNDTAHHAAQQQIKHDQDLVRTSLEALGAAMTTAREATRGLTQAQRELAAAQDVDTFIRNINRQTGAARQFERDLARLIRQGNVDLAKQLAEAGPEQAGALAHSLASHPAKAAAAEAAIDNAKAFTDAYNDWIISHFGPDFAAQMGIVGQTAGQALTAGVQTGATIAAGTISASTFGAQPQASLIAAPSAFTGVAAPSSTSTATSTVREITISPQITLAPVFPPGMAQDEVIDELKAFTLNELTGALDNVVRGVHTGTGVNG